MLWKETLKEEEYSVFETAKVKHSQELIIKREENSIESLL